MAPVSILEKLRSLLRLASRREVVAAPLPRRPDFTLVGVRGGPSRLVFERHLQPEAAPAGGRAVGLSPADAPRRGLPPQ